MPAACLPGNAHEDTLLPQTAAELTRLGLKVREVALDGGFTLAASTDSLSELAPERVFISGRQQPGSRRTQRRLQRYRTGAEGRISHLKRGYGLRRSRLKGHDGQKTTTGWGSWLTTSTRWPSEPADKLANCSSPEQPPIRERPRRSPRAAVFTPASYSAGSN